MNDEELSTNMIERINDPNLEENDVALRGNLTDSDYEKEAKR